MQLLPGRAHWTLIIACRCRWVAPGHAWWLLKPGRRSFKPGWMTSLQWDMRLQIQHLCAVVKQKISCWKLRGMEFQNDFIFCCHQTWSDRIDLHVWRPLKVASIGSRDETWRVRSGTQEPGRHWNTGDQPVQIKLCGWCWSNCVSSNLRHLLSWDYSWTTYALWSESSRFCTPAA